VPFDLGKIDDIPDLVRRLRKQFGPLYGLVNNAALGLSGALTLMRHTKIEEMVRLNTVSPIVLTKYVLRGMMADGAGRIVNAASIVASTGASGIAAYAATKASMVGFTRSLAREVGPLDITVNAVAPRILETDMTQVLSDEWRAQVAPQCAQSPRLSGRRRRHGRVSAQWGRAQHHRHGHHRGRRCDGLARRRSSHRRWNAADEVNPGIKALRDNGIEVTALHSYMLTDEPRLFFMHFWANDDAIRLARGLCAALDKMKNRSN